MPHPGADPTHAPPARWSPLVPALALAAVLALLFGETLFGGRVLSQVDALYAFQPWKSVAPEGYEPGNPLLLDQSLLVHPWLEFDRASVARGELPLWNPDNFCGQPITAAYTGAFWWPPHWAYYAFPTPRYHAWAAWGRLLAAGVFTLLLLRGIGVGRGAAAIGAAGYALCGWLVVWLNHPHVNAALFLPALFLLVERAARAPSRRVVGWTALAVALTLFGGHVQTAFQVFGIAGSWALYRALVPVEGRRLGARGLGAFVGGAVLGVVLASPQVVPFVEYLGESQVLRLPEDFNPVDPIPSQLDAASLMVAPDRLGRPDRGDYTGPLGSNLNYSELIGGYVGRLVLLLAAAQLVLGRRDRRTWYFAGLSASCLLVSWQVEPLYSLASRLPVLENTKLMRLSLFAAFGLAILAAQGAHGLASRTRLSPSRTRALLALAFAIVAVELGTWAHGFNPATEPEHLAPSSPVVEYLQARRDELAPEPMRVVGADNTALLANANLFHGLAVVGGYDYIENWRTTELVARTTTDERGAFFTKEIRYFDRPEALPLLGLLGVRYLIAEFDLSPLCGPPVFEDRGVGVFQNPRWMPRAFVARGVEVVADDDARLARLGSAEFDPTVALLDDGESSRALVKHLGPVHDAARGSARIAKYAPREVEIELDLEAPSLVVLADAWYPGWTAEVDGEPAEILCVDHALRGVLAPAGAARLRFEYDPPSMRLGLLLGALGLAGTLGLLLPLRRRRDPVDEELGATS